MKIFLHQYKHFFFLLLLLVFTGNVNGQTYTITGNVNASTLTCATFIGYTTISIGNGSTPTSLIMDDHLDLTTCGLGPIQIIVNNATLDFTTANKRLLLPEGSSISFINGGTINPAGGNGGGCTGNDRIYIGTAILASCQGDSGELGFNDLITFGGTGRVTSNSPVCVGNSINLTSFPPPNGGPYTYQWSGPNGYSSTSQNPASFTATTTPNTAGVYIATMTSTTLSPNRSIVIQTTVVVNSAQAAPTVGTITHPSCTVATGSVVLSGLPAGNWTINPGGITGNTASRAISGLAAGTYNFTVTSASNCTSSATANVVINAQPITPIAPTVGTITHPTCAVATGSVVLNGLPAGNWTINPGGITGNTAIRTISGLAAGTYNFTVTNALGCTSLASANVVINAQPITPVAPTVGTITHPTCSVATGSVVLSGLPAGNWTINPGAITGNTASRTISGLAAGTYNFTVSNGTCTSLPSANVVINTQPATPAAPTVGTITQPTCSVATGSVILNGLPAGNWTINPGGITGNTVSRTILGLAAGTYNFTVSNGTCTSLPSANVVINAQPSTPSTPTIIAFTPPTFANNDGTITLDNLPAGAWTGYQIKDGVTVTNISGTGSPYTITGLAYGSYEFQVIGLCISPTSTATALITVPYTPAVSAATNIYCTGFTANWPATPTATSYLLDVSTVSNFATFVGIYQNLNVGNVLTYPLTGMPSGPLYYRIRAQNALLITLYSATITVPFTPALTIDAGATPNPVCIGESLTLTSPISITSYMGSLINESFNGTTNSWTTINNSTGGVPANAAWTLRPDDYQIDCNGDRSKLRSNDGSQFYLSNSCEQGNGAITATILQSPVMSTIGFTTLSLEFYHYLQFYHASAKVEVSTNGTTWTTLVDYNSETIGKPNKFAQEIINLDSYTGNPTFYIRFKYDVPWGWYWAIDNVIVSGTNNSPIAWTGPNGFHSALQNPIITDVTDANAGVYTLTYTDPNGCTATDSVNVLVNPLPTIAFTPAEPSICLGDSTVLTASGADTYVWSPPVGLSSTIGASVTANPTTTTIYAVTGIDTNGCSNTSSVEVAVRSLPSLSVTPAAALICTSPGTPLTADGAGPSGTYTWSPSTGLSSTSGATVTATPSVATTYTVTGNTVFGCSSSETVFVDVIPSPPTTGVTICPGGTGELTATGICPPGNAITAGPRYPGTADTTFEAGFLWNIPANSLAADDSSYAELLLTGPGIQTSDYLFATNYGFTIPANATIIGIAVDIGRSQDASDKHGEDIRDLNVHLINTGNNLSLANYADTVSEWPEDPISEKNYGGNTDLWGDTWTPGYINSTSFGVALRIASEEDRTARVDYMRISVTYTLPGVLNWYTTVSGGSPIATGSPFNPVGVAGSGLVDTSTPGTYTYYAECSSDSRCRTLTNFVIYSNASIASVTGTSPLCIGLTTSYAANTAELGGGIGTWSSDNPAIASVDPATGLVTGVAAGTCNIIYTITGGCGGTKSAQQSITINLIPTAPTVGTITPPVCAIATGSVLLSGLPAAGTINQTGTVSASYPITGTTMTISGLAEGTYAFTVTDASGTCTSPISTNATITPGTATWNVVLGVGSWTNGPPTINQNIVINGDYSSTGNLEGCSLLVNPGFTVTINAGDTLTLTNELIVSPTGSMTFENNSSLVQINNVVNTGNITYNRIAQQKRLDYVYWSSPVENFNIGSHSSNGYKYSWNTLFANANGTQGNWQGASGIMIAGKGYIVGGPSSFNNNANQNLQVPFIGVPRNGDISIAINRGSYTGATYTLPSGAQVTALDDNWNLLGNPYPSAISCRDFLTLNSSVLTGALNIWSHGILPSTFANNPFYDSFVSNYNPNDYIQLNLTGNLANPNPDYYIGACQGFFVTMIDGPAGSATVNFNNSLRNSTYGNSTGANFLKTANTTNTESLELNRIWLELNNANQAVRTLVGYVSGATMGTDNLYDAISKRDNSLKIFSLENEDKFIIQARALPFNDMDQVKMGIDIYEAGQYYVSIAMVDGLFIDSSQDIYLEDKLLNVIHNLRVAPYPFTSAVGTFTDRFVLRYTNTTLGNPTHQTDNTFAYISNHTLKIQSTEEIKEITLYDISGKLFKTYTLDSPNTHFESDFPYTNGFYIAAIKLNNDIVVTKKLIH